jgi:adenylate cyclase
MTAHKSLRFEGFTLDLDRLCLDGPTGQANLRRKSFEVLRHLVERAGRVVTKEELIAAVWPDVTVGDESLTQCVSEVRRALGDRGQRIIKTIARRGYLVDVPISAGDVAAEPPPVSSQKSAPAEPLSLIAPPLPLLDRPSIAVLPFANMSGDPEQEYFADGMVDDLLSALSRIRWLFVIARQSSFSYKGRAVEVKRIARELGVRYIVEGSVRKSSTRVRIAAQLIDAETDAHIWADRYDRDLNDIFALQDEITERIVSAIEPTVRAVEIKRSLAKPTSALNAYEGYLRALPYYYSQSREGLAHAEDLLQRAVEFDPDYAEALGTLADVMTSRIANGWHASRKHEIDDVCEAASRALAAGPNNSTCIAAAAYAFAVLARRFEEAEQLAERAIAVHPNSTFVRNRAGAVYSNSGESDKAIAQITTALRMNPLDNITSTFTFTVGAVAHFFARRFEESLYWGRRATAITPQARIPLWCAAAALGHLGRLEEAHAEIDRILELHPAATLARARIASFRHDWMYDLYLDGLRKAGLPE